jgi:hypothetical protein
MPQWRWKIFAGSNIIVNCISYDISERTKVQIQIQILQIFFGITTPTKTQMNEEEKLYYAFDMVLS